MVPNAAGTDSTHGPVHGWGTHVAAQVARYARTRPDALAVTDLSVDGPGLTYRQLDDRAGRLGAVLEDAGVRTGDRVAVLMTNRAEYVEAIVAIARLGAVGVLLNFRLTSAEVTFQLRDSGAVALLTDPGLAATAEEARAGTAVTFVLEAGPAWEQQVAGVAGPIAERHVDEGAAGAIIYTSGTTGNPKGATLTHRNQSASVHTRLASRGHLANCESILCAVPLFHVAGFMNGITSLVLGHRLVIMPSGSFDAGEMIQVLVTQRISLAFFVPTQWQAIVEHPTAVGREFPDLLSASWGTAPAGADLVRAIQRTFPRAFLTAAFGMTETTGTLVSLMPEDVVERPDSVGKPVPGCDVRVVDEDMNDVPPGVVGEIVFRGPTVMAGYWNSPDQTEEAFRGGWFHSGDLVRTDDEGFIYVVDRIKDMIISGGENVYCAEVEKILADHPKVGSVAVIGVPDQRWGEVPVAVVVPRNDDAPTAAELEAHGRAHLAAYKVPKRVCIVEELPRNASGKVLKAEVRELVRGDN